MKKNLLWICACLATLVVTACGGGANSDTAASSAPPETNTNLSSTATSNSASVAQCGLALSSEAQVLANICQIGTKAADCSISNTELSQQATLVTSQLGVSTTYSFTPACGDVFNTLLPTSLSGTSQALITAIKTGSSTSIQIAGNIDTIVIANSLPLGTGTQSVELNSNNTGSIVIRSPGSITLSGAGTGATTPNTNSTGTGGTLDTASGATISTNGSGSLSGTTLSIGSATQCGLALTDADNTVQANICFISGSASNCTASNPEFASYLLQVSNLLGQPVTASVTPACSTQPDYTFILQ